MELKEEQLEEIKQYLKEYVDMWLNMQKETLLLQLVGFIQHTKDEMEHKIGTTEVQKIFSDDKEEMKNKVL